MHTHTRKRQGFHICDGEGVRMCMHVCVCAWKGVELLSVEISSRHRRNLFPRQKRPVVTTKETCIRGKRNLHWWQKRPAFVTKETCICDKRDLHVWQKKPVFCVETYSHAKGTHAHTKKDVLTQKRPIHAQTRPIYTREHLARDPRDWRNWKETHAHTKRDLFTQMGPIHAQTTPLLVTLETRAFWKKNSVFVTKETCIRDKTNLLIYTQ